MNADYLKSLSLEELWKLFPIVLEPYNPIWKSWADDEIAALGNLLTDFSPAINHIGSTSIPRIMAKPIVDILVEISADRDWGSVRRILEEAGYICMSETENRMSFNTGYTPQGYADKVLHIHVHAPGDNDEIVFRDYLIHHPDVAKKYEHLKLSLLPKFKHDRDGYTGAKTTFIRGVLRIANLKF